MYTVIICDKDIIADCKEKYKMHFKPFLKNDQIAFCRWNIDGLTLSESVPELRGLTENQKEWRAVIVYDKSVCGIEQMNSRNPFDAVNYKVFNEITSPEQAIEYREYVNSTTVRALSNPLQKLSVWLSGTTVKRSKLTDEKALKEAAPGTDEYAECLKREKLTMEEAEIKLARIYRFDELSKKYDLDGELFTPPSSIIAVTERSRDVSCEVARAVWENHTEFDSSKFYVDNMYSEKLRYVVYDMPTKKGRRFEKSYFAFLLTLLIMAENAEPDGALRPERVYNISIDLDYERIKEICLYYNARLSSTLLRIEKAKKDFARVVETPITNKEADKLEEKVEIPVQIDSEFDTQELFARYRDLGLSGDCPKDEYGYWHRQYDKIVKLFLKYIREPRRAVKRAVSGPFTTENSVTDVKMLRMNQFQAEDVELELAENEEEMVKTTTTHLFETAKYRESLDEADKELKREIGKRMTRKKTLCVCGIAFLAYLIGFIPMIIGSYSKLKSVGPSFLITAVTMGIFALCGLVCLFVFRHRLVNRFKHFNYVMGGILDSIALGLRRFSKYLTAACNVMRDFSIINYIKNGISEHNKVFAFHRSRVERIIADNHILFPDNTESKVTFDLLDDDLPYNYDFTVFADYDYPVPYKGKSKQIEFMQKGNMVDVWVDYVESVTLTREELYD